MKDDFAAGLSPDLTAEKVAGYRAEQAKRKAAQRPCENCGGPCPPGGCEIPF